MSYQYRKSNCGNKTILGPSYLHNGISYTVKMTSLYWFGALVPDKISGINWNQHRVKQLILLCFVDHIFSVIVKSDLPFTHTMQGLPVKQPMWAVQYGIFIWNSSLLKVADIHTVSVLCFVNNCRAARFPETFCNYYQVLQTERELRNKDHLDVPWARTDMGLSSCNIKGARLWNENFPAVNPYLYKKCFKTRVTKYFIEKYVWWLCKILTPDVSRL